MQFFPCIFSTHSYFVKKNLIFLKKNIIFCCNVTIFASLKNIHPVGKIEKKKIILPSLTKLRVSNTTFIK